MNARRWILVGLVAMLIALVAALSTSRPGPDVVDTLRDEVSEDAAPAAAARLQTEGAQSGSGRREVESPPPEARDPERAPVLVAGRVVDDAAQPVEDYTVWAAAIETREEGPTTVRLPDSLTQKGPVHVLDPTRERVFLRNSLRVENDSAIKAIRLEDGYFEVRGWTQQPRITVRATHEGRSLGQDFAVGTSDAVLVFARLGIVRARLLHDPGINPRAFDVSLRKRADWPPIPLAVARYERPGERSFEKREVTVGTYSLEVRLRENPDPLILLEGIVVEPGGACRDPRLDRIDVRGLCRRMTVTFLRPDGRPLPLPAYLGAEVTALDPHGEPLPVQPKLRKSRVELTTHHGYVDLNVRMKHYREVHLPLLREDCAVRVEPSDESESENR